MGGGWIEVAGSGSVTGVGLGGKPIKYQSFDSNLYKRKKMSQAEKHKGWVKMKNLSSIKISIQVHIGCFNSFSNRIF